MRCVLLHEMILVTLSLVDETEFEKVPVDIRIVKELQRLIVLREGHRADIPERARCMMFLSCFATIQPLATVQIVRNEPVA